jgi:hypothetical protein
MSEQYLPENYYQYKYKEMEEGLIRLRISV